AFVVALCANVTTIEGELLVRVLLCCGGLFVAVSVLSRRHAAFPEGAVAWQFFGWLGFLLCTYLLTFPGIVEELLGWRHWEGSATGHELMRLFYSWAPLILGLLAWLFVAWPLRRGAPRGGRPQDCALEYWLIPSTALLCQLLAVAQLSGSKWE